MSEYESNPNAEPKDAPEQPVDENQGNQTPEGATPTEQELEFEVLDDGFRDERKAKDEYVETDLEALSDLEHVRKRPSMYIGDVAAQGLHHLVNEVVDNSLDEALAGFATEISVTINANGSVTVEDDGRGIPVG
ncbi:MAG: DNA gyrase subunit B, partial [Thermoguttaceae bacterium]|nr:DNA gyrase subunit B [Thermoguttaceae bacterium]